MIAPAEVTPIAGKAYLQTKIRYLESGMIKSSPQAQKRFCHIQRHDRGTCTICSPQNKIKEDSSEIMMKVTRHAAKDKDITYSSEIMMM